MLRAIFRDKLNQFNASGNVMQFDEFAIHDPLATIQSFSARVPGWEATVTCSTKA